MSHSIVPARLLTDHLQILQDLSIKSGVLDLACGYGRNGMWLARHKIPVTFADNNRAVIDAIEQLLEKEGLTGDCWHVDLELNSSAVLKDKCFDAILVFNYLHRPLLQEIKQAIRPGGIIMYQTFTTAQSKWGQPSNPDFLLQPDELAHCFDTWQLLHNYEGELTDPHREVAQLIARKPDSSDLAKSSKQCRD